MLQNGNFGKWCRTNPVSNFVMTGRARVSSETHGPAAKLIDMPNWRRDRVPEAAFAAGAPVGAPSGHARPLSKRPM